MVRKESDEMVGENPHASGSGQVRMHHQPEGLIRADLRLQALQPLARAIKCGRTPNPRPADTAETWATSVLASIFTRPARRVRVIHWAAGRCW